MNVKFTEQRCIILLYLSLSCVLRGYSGYYWNTCLGRNEQMGNSSIWRVQEPCINSKFKERRYIKLYSLPIGHIFKGQNNSRWYTNIKRNKQMWNFPLRVIKNHVYTQTLKNRNTLTYTIFLLIISSKFKMIVVRTLALSATKRCRISHFK